MTRVVFGMALAAALVVVPALAWAQGDPRVKASRGRDHGTISMQAGKLSVTQKLTRTALDLQLAEGGDVLRLTGDLEGNVVIERGAVRHAFSMRTGGADDQRIVLALLADSAPLRSFDALMRTAWGRSSRAATVFRSAHSLLALFRGDERPVQALTALAPAPVASIVPVRRDGPSACWTTYTLDVVRYTYQLESCVDESRNSYFMFHLAWCAYEYDIKTSLALMWLLDCNGLL